MGVLLNSLYKGTLADCLHYHSELEKQDSVVLSAAPGSGGHMCFVLINQTLGHMASSTGTASDTKLRCPPPLEEDFLIREQGHLAGASVIEAGKTLKLGDETMYPHPDKPGGPSVQICTEL